MSKLVKLEDVKWVITDHFDFYPARILKALSELPSQESKEGWVDVDGYKEVPYGRWLVCLESETLGEDIFSANIQESVPIIGNYFAWDMPKVIAYQPLPSPPTK